MEVCENSDCCWLLLIIRSHITSFLQRILSENWPKKKLGLAFPAGWSLRHWTPSHPTFLIGLWFLFIIQSVRIREYFSWGENISEYCACARKGENRNDVTENGPATVIWLVARMIFAVASHLSGIPRVK